MICARLSPTSSFGSVGTRRRGRAGFLWKSDSSICLHSRSHVVIGSKMTASFTNASDGHEIELSLKGSIMGRSAEIVLGDRPVATISRQLFNAREAFTDNQTCSSPSFALRFAGMPC